MRRRVYKGIPPQVQGQSPKPQARLYSQDLKQIDLGGNRAFRNRIMFRERYGINQQIKLALDQEMLFRALTPERRGVWPRRRREHQGRRGLCCPSGRPGPPTLLS
ncbi:USP6 N-terminal-like protein [Tursiops truncatus]|uniref:USP6 N-terminal-like protein n=1 Tax=Tursiops truncatus TaxID=9739 RepID=UPI003CCEF9C0